MSRLHHLCCSSCRSEFPFHAYDESVCPGNVNVVFFSQAINVSFLYLFGAFYIKSYLTKPADSKKDAKKETKKTK